MLDATGFASVAYTLYYYKPLICVIITVLHSSVTVLALKFGVGDMLIQINPWGPCPPTPPSITRNVMPNKFVNWLWKGPSYMWFSLIWSNPVQQF